MSKIQLPTLKSARSLTIVYEIPTSRTSKFWEKLKGEELFTTKCKKCGELYFPPSSDCPKCLSSDMEWVKLSCDAELETYTLITVRPGQSFVAYEPYIVAIGRLKEGVKVLAWLTGVKLEDIKVGMKLKLVPKTTPEGRLTYEYIPSNQ